MVDSIYSSNSQHEYAADPGSELAASQKSISSRFSTIQPHPTIFQQVVVREVFFDPTILDENRIEEIVQKYKINQIDYLNRLPRNSILAEIVKDGTAEENPVQIFFPFFPQHMMLPIKAGERAWVYSEHGKIVKYGYWICRVTEPRDIDDINITHSDRKLDFVTKDSEPPTFINGVFKKVIDSSDGSEKNKIDENTISINGDENEIQKIIKNSDSSAVFDFEAIPRYTSRPGDYVIQGSNNTLISLGTDRQSSAFEIEDNKDAQTRKGKRAKGKPKVDVKKSAGTIDIVVGRGTGKNKGKIVNNSLNNEEIEKRTDIQNEGDPDFENDLSRIYVSMKTAADQNFNIKPKGEITLERDKEDAAIVVKSNHLRFIARKEIKILVQSDENAAEEDCPAIVIKSSGDIVIVPAQKGVIKLGGDDANKAILCSSVGVVSAGGKVTSPPLVTTMGGVFGNEGAHGTFSSKVLIK